MGGTSRSHKACSSSDQAQVWISDADGIGFESRMIVKSTVSPPARIRTAKNERPIIILAFGLSRNLSDLAVEIEDSGGIRGVLSSDSLPGVDILESSRTLVLR
jgi:hypothetical protein